MFYGLELGKLKEYIYMGVQKRPPFRGGQYKKITLKETCSVSCRSPFWSLWHLVCFVEDYLTGCNQLLFQYP